MDSLPLFISTVNSAFASSTTYMLLCQSGKCSYSHEVLSDLVLATTRSRCISCSGRETRGGCGAWPWFDWPTEPSAGTLSSLRTRRWFTLKLSVRREYSPYTSRTRSASGFARRLRRVTFTPLRRSMATPAPNDDYRKTRERYLVKNGTAWTVMD